MDTCSTKTVRQPTALAVDTLIGTLKAMEVSAQSTRNGHSSKSNKKRSDNLQNPVSSSDENHSRSSLQVLPCFGKEVEHQALIELKTRRERGPAFPIDEKLIYSQAIWSSTPCTLIAWHSGGRFSHETRYNLDDLRQSVAGKQVEDDVRKVTAILQRILTFMRSKPVGVKYCLLYYGPKTRTATISPRMLYLAEGGRGSGYLENKRR